MDPNDDYHKFLARQRKQEVHNKLHEIVIGTTIYIGIGLYMFYQYSLTGDHGQMTMGWWVIGGWLYYKYGIKRWR